MPANADIHSLYFIVRCCSAGKAKSWIPGQVADSLSGKTAKAIGGPRTTGTKTHESLQSVRNFINAGRTDFISVTMIIDQNVVDTWKNKCFEW